MVKSASPVPLGGVPVEQKKVQLNAKSEVEASHPGGGTAKQAGQAVIPGSDKVEEPPLSV